jgi:protein-S-isoprenylcysteine O-methyltransferase Ste14
MFRHSMAQPQPQVREGFHIERPNREKAASKATKAVVILLLLVSAGLMLIVTLGGWERLAGMQVVQVGYLLVYLVMAYYAARWNRGVLPIAAALAMVLAIFAAIAGPQWFDRDKTGFDPPALDDAVLGLVTLLLVPVQALLIAFSMRGFQQAWNVEVEVPDGQHYHPGMQFEEGGRSTAPA